MLDLVVQNHPHRTGPDFGREFVRRLACHGSTFSRVGASGNPGAVHRRPDARVWSARRTSFGVRHVSMANCSSLGLASLNQPSASTWSNDVDLQVRDGGPFCETTLRTLPPWICSWSRPLASNCCMAS